MRGAVLGGRYRLDERFSVSAVAEVWRGYDGVLGRTVAVKILPPRLQQEPGFSDQFVAGARAVATLKHPNIVDVYDIGPGYVVMEYVDGGSLTDAVRQFGRLTAARSMKLVAQIADALQAAHDRGVVHRDVRGENVLVRRDGTAILTGFDFALSTGNQAGGPNPLLIGAVSPEQALGRLATPLSDVYALGVVGFHCLAGGLPFGGASVAEMANRHVRYAPPPLPMDVPVAVRQIVERAMAKDPGHRFPNAAALAMAARSVTAARARA